MAKIYRRQRHSRDGEDSVSDDDDEGLWLLKSVFIDSVSDSIKKTELISLFFHVQPLREARWHFTLGVGLTLPRGPLALTGEAC